MKYKIILLGFLFTFCGGVYYNPGFFFSFNVVNSGDKPVVNLQCELIDLRSNEMIAKSWTNEKGYVMLEYKFEQNSKLTKEPTPDEFCKNNFSVKITDIDGTANGGHFKTKEIKNLSCDSEQKIVIDTSS